MSDPAGRLGRSLFRSILKEIQCVIDPPPAAVTADSNPSQLFLPQKAWVVNDVPPLVLDLPGAAKFVGDSSSQSTR